MVIEAKFHLSSIKVFGLLHPFSIAGTIGQDKQL